MVHENRNTVSIGELRIGSQASTSYYDAKGLLLIAKGVVITEMLVEKLRRHGVETLHIEVDSAAVTRGPTDRRDRVSESPTSRPAAQKPRGSGTAKFPPAGRRSDRQTPDRQTPDRQTPDRPDEASSTADGDRHDGPPPRSPRFDSQPALRGYPSQKIARIGRLHRHSLETVDRIAEGLTEGRSPRIQETDPILDGYLKELAEDPDPVVATALLYDANLDLAKRCLQFSTLSLAVGMQMELTSASLRELGLAALIHDWGLFELPVDSRFPHHKMTEPMRLDYQRHPIVAESMMQSVPGSTFTLAMLVSQVHELMNGTGFPRRLDGAAIHPLARVLSAIDTYLTLTSPPKGHPRIVPCDAVAYLLNGVKLGQYAPTAVSALLETVTLYPIGSLIELSDATQARVLRGNGRDYGYPIVERLDDPGILVDLKGHSLYVTRPVLIPDYHEVRLPPSYTDLSSLQRD